MGDDFDEKPCISFLARDVQPAAKAAKARVEEEKGARPSGLVWTAATKGWRTCPWPSILHAEPQLATKSAKARVEEENGTRPLGPVSTAKTEEWKPRPWSFTPHAEQAIPFGRPVAEEKSNLCYTFRMASDEKPVEKALMASSSAAVISEDSVHSNLATLMAPAPPFPGEVREPLSKRASTPSGERASPVTAQPLPAPVLATGCTGNAICINRIHRPNVVTRRAASELTGAVPRYKGVRPDKNNKDDDNINSNNHAALAERFPPSTPHKLQQLGLYTNTDTLEDSNINNNNHAALAERFQPSTLHKLRQLGRYIITDTPDTARQLDAKAVLAEVTYTRTNTVREGENRTVSRTS